MRFFWRSGRGSAQVVALVLLLPLLAALIYGTVMYGQMADVANIVEEAARAGARWLAAHPGDAEGARRRAAEVVLGSFTSREGIEGAAAPQGGLVGRLEKKRDGGYYVSGQRIRPADEAVRRRLDSLVGKTVVAQGGWAEARVFEARAATTDPPETRAWEQQGGGSSGQPGAQGSQTASQTLHPGPFPAAALAKYGQEPWGTWWVSPAENPGDQVYEKKRIDFTDEGGSTAYWNPSFSAPSGAVIKEVSFKTAPAYDDYFTTQRVEGYKNGKWYVIKDYRNIHGNYKGSVSDTIDLKGKGYTKIRFNFVMYDRAGSAYGSPGDSYIRVTYSEPSTTNGWPDPEAWWIWGQPCAARCAPNGQEVALASPVLWTQGYARYRLYATADDHFSVKIDNTVVLQGSGRGVKTWDWAPGPGRPVQLVVTARNDYGPAGFLCSLKQAGWHWPTSYAPQPIPGGLVKYPAWTVPSAQWVTVTAKDRYGRAMPVYVGTGNQGNFGNISTNGALRLQVNRHRADVWSSPWSPPGGGKIKRIHIKGRSERNYDYGYVYGWNGSSWVLLAKECSPGYNRDYDKWIDVSNRNITKIRTRLTTDRSILYSPTYVDVPEVEVGANWVASGSGTLRFYAYPNTTYFVCVGSSQRCSVTVDFDGRVVLRSDASWRYTPVDGVRYGSATFPQKVSPNTEFTVELSATNASYKEWFAKRPSWWPNSWNNPDSWRTRFSYHWYDDKGNLVVQDGLRTDLPKTVRPGETVALDLKVRTPSQPGRYRLAIDGVQEYCAWFGPLQGVNWPTLEAWIDVRNIDYGVSYDPAQVPRCMVAGETYAIQVVAKNTGSLTWTPGGRFGLSYHWYDKNSGRVAVWDGARDYVDYPVAPGQSYTFSLPVAAPPKPGTYTLEIDMVREGVTWFKDRGCPVLRADVVVPQGDVLKGLLTYDGEDWWAAGALVRPAGSLDLSRLSGRSAVLWGSWTGRTERFFRATSVEEFVPGDWTAVETFNPEADVLAEEKDGYAHVVVTYHYPVPLRRLFTLVGLAEEPPSRAIKGEAYFRTGEAP